MNQAQDDQDAPPALLGRHSFLRVACAILIVGLTLFSVFVLPFVFPPSIPSRSTAYAAGASNRVAEIAVGLLSLAVGFVTLRFGRSAPSREPGQPIPRRWLWYALAGMSAFLLILGAAMVRANIFYGEAEYFLTQIEKGLKLHLVLYRTVQFAYGPLLYWWPILWIKALHLLGIGTMSAYVGALLTTQAAGISLLFYTVRALPIRKSLQTFAFAALIFGSLPPTLGPNYCIFRFVVPMAFAVFLARRPSLSVAAIVAALGTMAGFAVSSEAGIACLGGALACAVCRAFTASVRWLTLVPAALAGAAAFVLLTGPDYFQMLRDAGTGGYDLLLTPEPRTLLLLIGVVALAPIALARALRRNDPSAATLAAIYGTTLGVIPVALGRCDSVHEFSFGLGAILLSLVAIDAALTRWPAKLWIACIVAWIAMAQLANFHLYRNELSGLVRQAISPQPDTFDVKELERQLHGQPVFLADDVTWTANEELLDKHLLMPSFFVELSSIWREPAEQRKIAEMRAGNFALTQDGGLIDDSPFDSGAIHRWIRLGIPYREKHAPYVPGLLVEQELQRNWTPVAEISGSTLYRKLR